MPKAGASLDRWRNAKLTTALLNFAFNCLSQLPKIQR